MEDNKTGTDKNNGAVDTEALIKSYEELQGKLTAMEKKFNEITEFNSKLLQTKNLPSNKESEEEAFKKQAEEKIQAFINEGGN